MWFQLCSPDVLICGLQSGVELSAVVNSLEPVSLDALGTGYAAVRKAEERGGGLTPMVSTKEMKLERLLSLRA